MNEERFSGITSYLQPSGRIQGRLLEIFENTVRSREPGFYRECDLAALETYCKAKALLEKLEGGIQHIGDMITENDKGDLKVAAAYTAYEKQARLVSSLMVRLRLVPNARVSKKVASRTTPNTLLSGDPERWADPENWRERLGLV